MSRVIEELTAAARDLRDTAHWTAKDQALTHTVKELREFGKALCDLSAVASAYVPRLSWVTEPMNRVGENLGQIMPASFSDEELWATVTDAVRKTGLAISSATGMGHVSHSVHHELQHLSSSMKEIKSIGPEGLYLRALIDQIGHCVQHIKVVQAKEASAK